MTSRLTRRAQIAIDLSLRLQLPEAETVIQTRCQSNHPLPGAFAIPSSGQLQLQLQLQKLHGQAPGLCRRRLIQCGFEQAVGFINI